jgi:RNA polymerase sigma-70 factor (family 1)
MKLKDLPNEQYWTSQFIKGNKLALNYFFQKHYQALCYFALRLTKDEEEAKDIVANCVVKLWNKHADFETALNIKAFLYISCRNGCLEFLRNLKRKTAAQQRYLEQLSESEDTILQEIIEAEFLRILHEEIRLLPGRSGEVFKLMYLDGKRTEEIALELDLSVQTVRNHKTRAIEMLKTAFLKKGVTGPIMIAFSLFIEGK